MVRTPDAAGAAQVEAGAPGRARERPLPLAGAIALVAMVQAQHLAKFLRTWPSPRHPGGIAPPLGNGFPMAQPAGPAPPQQPPPNPLREVALLFLKLGFIAFGGPAAHIAMMREEVVERRRWLDQQAFLDLLGATYLIPGPNSTELAIHLGLRRAGWAGLLAAGGLFILPAAVMVGVFARLYVAYGATPRGDALLYGIKPVVIALILYVLGTLGRAALKDRVTAGVAVAVLLLALAGVHEVLLLFGGAAATLLLRSLPGRAGRLPGRGEQALLFLVGGPAAGVAPAALGAPAVPASLGGLFAVFLKVGAVLYGSGYVLLAFLQADLVERLGWLTSRQLLDAVAVGQFTPGPVFTTATFIGYVIAGWPGAVVATVGIFLPSFVFVAATHPLLPRLRQSPRAAVFLDGVNSAALALMASVTWTLGRAALVDLPTLLLGAGALFLLARTRLNSAWIVLGGGIIGLLLRALLAAGGHATG